MHSRDTVHGWLEPTALNGQSQIVEGMYQSPILVQWQHAPERTRVLNVSVTELR